MFVSLEARVRCIPCGYGLRHIWTGTARINKRSLRFSGGIGAMDRACPECGTANPAAGLTAVPLSAYRLTADAAEQVQAYRLARWPELAGEVSR